jgi:hypothetical protein
MTALLPRRILAALLVPALVFALAAGAAGAGAPPERRDPALVAFLAIGGSLSDICGRSGQAHGTPHCDACRIAAGAILPTPSGDWRRLALAAPLEAPEPPAMRPEIPPDHRPWTPRAPPSAA